MFKFILNFIRRAPRRLAKLVIYALLLVLALLVGSAFLSPFMSDLEKWHIKTPKGDFDYGIRTFNSDFADYLEHEDKLFEGLDRFFVSAEGDKQKKGYSPIVRYVNEGMNNPSFFPTNYNRTQVLVPDQVKGGVLLLHGLTDSPYSMRTIAEIFHRNGFYVLSLRLPGHGTTPSGLLHVSWRDWRAAVRIAATHVTEKVKGKPFFVGGYSNGGALALEYTTSRVLADEALPDAVFLFSPAVAITGFARVSNWHKIVTWIPYFQKNRWLSILPEFDPFKYNSFAKNASAQTWALSRLVQNNLTKLNEEKRIDKMPAVLTFQSAVDATVLGEAVISRLYRMLTTPDSELVIFDIHRTSVLQRLLAIDPGDALKQLEADVSLPFRLTIVGNEIDQPEMKTRTKAPFSAEIAERSLDLRWPKHVYSLSHLAIPIPSDDPLYGDGSGRSVDFPFALGDAVLRGERGVLLTGTDLLVRIRYNPFFPVLEDKIEEWIKRYTKDRGQKK